MGKPNEYQTDKLFFTSPPCVSPSPVPSRRPGYYITAKARLEEDFRDEFTFYLHQDELWRHSAFNGEVASGYFIDRKAASRTLTKALRSTNAATRELIPNIEIRALTHRENRRQMQ